MPSVIINETKVNVTEQAYPASIRDGTDDYYGKDSCGTYPRNSLIQEVEIKYLAAGTMFIEIPKLLKEYAIENTTITKISFDFKIKHWVNAGKLVSLLFNETEIEKIYSVGMNSIEIIDNNSIEILLDSKEFKLKVPTRYQNAIWGECVRSTLTEARQRSLAIYSSESEYKPTISIHFEYNKPVSPTSLSPDKTVNNPRTPIRFSWDNKYTQTRFQLRYKVNSGTYKYIEKTSPLKYYEMPAETITASSGVVQWSIRTADESEVYSEWVDATFELGTETQVPPLLVKPKGDFVYGNTPILFEWSFIANSVEKQKTFELEYTLDKTTVTKVISITTDKQSYLLEHTHNSSTIGKWRLRVTNNYNEVSEWTDWEEFPIVGIPPIPQITEVSNVNILTIKWNSREQAAYEIVVYNREENIVYESGLVLSEIDREYTLQSLLENGKYRFQLTIYNKYDIASPVGTYTINISPEPIEVPSINVHEDDYCILVTSNALNGSVYRNNHHIGNLVNGEFYDYTGANERLYNYKVRSIIDGVYADSESKSAKVYFAYSTLALLSKPSEFIKLDMSLDKLPEQSRNVQYSGASFLLDGIPYPVFEFGEHTTETINIQYFVWQIAEMRKLTDAREDLIYRDDKGYVFIGKTLGINYNELFFGDNASFTLTKTRDAYE